MEDALCQDDDLGAEPVWPIRIAEGQPAPGNALLLGAAVAAGFGSLCAAARVLALHSQHTAAFWIANGVLTAFLLRRGGDRWWKFLVAAWIGDAAASLLLGAAFFPSVSVAVCNVAEVALAVLLLRRLLAWNCDLASPATIVYFLLFASGAAPAISGFLAAGCFHAAYGLPFWHLFAKWFPAHALGMAVMMPLVLAWSDPDFRKVFSRERLVRSGGVLLLVLFASIAVFQQTHYSLRFLCLPLLMLVVFEVGLLGATTAVFEMSVVGAFYTLRGHGPLWLEKGATMQGNILVLQLGLLVLVASVVPFAAMLECQRQLHRRVRRGMQRYRLLADNSRDIVVLSSLQGRRLYVSPAVHDALGWTREEWTGRDSVDLMHPEDVPSFRRMLQEMLHGEDRRTFRYRTLHKDGRYLWMEANLRTLFDENSGEPNAFVANVRDISLRVAAEQKLAEVHRQAQEQAQLDGLTQLANRRRFDEALEKEWRRGRRTGIPVALLLIDIDNFKRINDSYGHRAGDCCLQTLAGVLRQVARRPGDIAARYGGDEFAVLLPDVDPATATTLADSICMKVRQKLVEAGIGRALALTVSVGVAARIPNKNARADSLVEAADRALYAAKQQGRDRATTTVEREPLALALHPVQ